MGHTIIDNFPSILPRESDSLFRRYVEAHESELQGFDDDIDAVTISHQINNAEGEDLDRIGRIFGVVGRRLDREDPEYRAYLKAVVQAFAGRGTKFSMERAFATALDLEIDQAEDFQDWAIDGVDVVEDTVEVSYDVVFNEWPDHSGETISQIAQIVDPSGVDHAETIYKTDEELQLSADTIEVITRASSQNWDQSDWNTMGWAETNSGAGYTFNYGDSYGV